MQSQFHTYNSQTGSKLVRISLTMPVYILEDMEGWIRQRKVNFSFFFFLISYKHTSKDFFSSPIFSVDNNKWKYSICNFIVMWGILSTYWTSVDCIFQSSAPPVRFRNDSYGTLVFEAAMYTQETRTSFHLFVSAVNLFSVFHRWACATLPSLTWPKYWFHVSKTS